MATAQTVSGVLTDPQTIRLDRPLPLAAGPVRVTIEVRPAGPPVSQARMLEVMQQIWKEQEARGHVPPTVEEVDEWIREARYGWGD